MVAVVHTVAFIGFEGALVEVETDSRQGLPGIRIVGMGSRAIDEARERIRGAVRNSLLTFPARKVTINLAPAELPKEGAHFDLSLALSILIASDQLRQTEVAGAIFVGELGLEGDVKPIRGAITIAETAHRLGYHSVYLPEVNAPQAALIKGVSIYPVKSLKQLYLHLKQAVPILPLRHITPRTTPVTPSLTLDDIQGLAHAKRAIEIAVAGRHNILLCGPPGAGKTMLAKVAASLLPPLSFSEQLMITKIHSLHSGYQGRIVTERPFRSPHHTASRAAIIGGGSKAIPGEITLAHLGVLFLDELPEYPRSVLESLRQPLEDKLISVTRLRGNTLYPADFMLIATMNPCPCGYYGDSSRECTCTMTQILQYQKKISGPLLDRIDLVVTLSTTPQNKILMLNSLNKNQHSKVVEVIKIVQGRQFRRYKSSAIYNGNISSQDVAKYFTLSPAAQALLTTATTRLTLSTRGYFKVIKVAQTIADLADSPMIEAVHISEALQFRERLAT